MTKRFLNFFCLDSQESLFSNSHWGYSSRPPALKDTKKPPHDKAKNMTMCHESSFLQNFQQKLGFITNFEIV